MLGACCGAPDELWTVLNVLLVDTSPRPRRCHRIPKQCARWRRRRRRSVPAERPSLGRAHGAEPGIPVEDLRLPFALLPRLLAQLSISHDHEMCLVPRVLNSLVWHRGSASFVSSAHPLVCRVRRPPMTYAAAAPWGASAKQQAYHTNNSRLLCAEGPSLGQNKWGFNLKNRVFAIRDHVRISVRSSNRECGGQGEERERERHMEMR